MSEETKELLPCPWCRGANTSSVKIGDSYVCYCHSCRCVGPKASDELGAIHFWNTRLYNPYKQQVEELRSALAAVDRWLPRSPANHDEVVICNKVRKALNTSPRKADNE